MQVNNPVQAGITASGGNTAAAAPPKPKAAPVAPSAAGSTQAPAAVDRVSVAPLTPARVTQVVHTEVLGALIAPAAASGSQKKGPASVAAGIAQAVQQSGTGNGLAGVHARIDQGVQAAHKVLTALGANQPGTRQQVATIQNGLHNMVTKIAASVSTQVTGTTGTAPAAPAQTAVPAANAGAVSAAALGSIGQARATDLTITTRQGDQVTLHVVARRKVGAAVAAAITGNGAAAAGATGGQRSLSVSFSVKGNLNANELHALSGLLRGVSKAANEFFEGETGEAFDKLAALKVNPDAIARVALNFSSRTTLTYAAVQGQGAANGAGSPASPAPAAPAQPAAAQAAPAPAAATPLPTRVIRAPVAPVAATGGAQAPAVTSAPSAPVVAQPVIQVARQVKATVESPAAQQLFKSPGESIAAMFRAVFEAAGAVQGGKGKAPDAVKLLLSMVDALAKGTETEGKDKDQEKVEKDAGKDDAGVKAAGTAAKAKARQAAPVQAKETEASESHEDDHDEDDGKSATAKA